MPRVDQAEKVEGGEAKRCRLCENCKKFEKARRSCLACCGTPRKDGNGFHHADDGVVQVWNDACRDYPCLAYIGCDGAGPHQDGPTYKFTLYGSNDDNVYILCRRCWEAMEKEHMEEEVVPHVLPEHATKRIGGIKAQPVAAQKLMVEAMDAEDAFGADELEAHAAKLRRERGEE